MDFSKWRPESLHEMKNLVFHNYNVLFGIKHIFQSDQFLLLIYLCLLPSSATVKMDNGENMKNARYATNDDTVAFTNQLKNRNTSRNIEYDMELIKNYFASIGEIRKKHMTLLHHMPQLLQILRKTHWRILYK